MPILWIFLGLVLFLYLEVWVLVIGFGIMALSYFLGGKFIRGTILICLAAAGVLWLNQDQWIPHPHQVYAWANTSAWYIGLVIVAVICYKLKKYQQARTNVPAFGTLPVADGNVIPFVKATRKEKERVMQIQKHKCANPYCNQDLRDCVPHWDHIYPRSNGGTDSVHNMQWLCDTCNLNKGDRSWLQFLFTYATGMGMDPNKNQEPWKKWVLTRTQNGLQCQG